MGTHSVYHVEYDSVVSYLVLAPSEEAALRCLWETAGTSEADWRENSGELSVNVIPPDKWGTVFMKEDEVGEPLKAVSVVVAETKLGPDQSEVLCCSEY